MDVITSLSIVAFSALIHASFQLSVSVLMLLGGHALGAKRSAANVTRMTTSFIIGAGLMTALLLSFVSLILLSFFRYEIPEIVWASASGLSIGVAVAVWLFYYQRGKGTVLWVPRGMAEYLNSRTKATKLSAEAFGLGLSSVFGELLFIIAPLFVSALVLIQLPPMMQLLGIGIYVFISMISLIIVWVLIGSGHHISQIQRWREANKNFLQFSAGSGLLILSFIVFAMTILSNSGGAV